MPMAMPTGFIFCVCSLLNKPTVPIPKNGTHHTVAVTNHVFWRKTSDTSGDAHATPTKASLLTPRL